MSQTEMVEVAMEIREYLQQRCVECSISLAVLGVEMISMIHWAGGPGCVHWGGFFLVCKTKEK